MTTERAKTAFFRFFRHIHYYIIAVVCATAFFIHASVEKDTPAVIDARQVHKEAKSNRTDALEALKLAASHLPEYQTYLNEKQATDEAWEVLEREKANQRFFNFPSLYWFLGEAWSIGLCLIFLFLIGFNLLTRRKWHPILFVHFTGLYCGVFYTLYLFLPKQDFTNPAYYTYSCIVVAIVLILATYLLVNLRYSRMIELLNQTDRLKSVVRSLVDKILRQFHEKELIDKNKIEAYQEEERKTIDEVYEAL